MQTAETSTGKKQFNGGVQAGVHMVKSGGVSSLFRGVESTIVREIIQFGIYYPVYTSLKSAVADNVGPSYAPLMTPVIGGIAGACQVSRGV